MVGEHFAIELCQKTVGISDVSHTLCYLSLNPIVDFRGWSTQLHKICSVGINVPKGNVSLAFWSE